MKNLLYNKRLEEYLIKNGYSTEYIIKSSGLKDESAINETDITKSTISLEENRNELGSKNLFRELNNIEANKDKLKLIFNFENIRLQEDNKEILIQIGSNIKEILETKNEIIEIRKNLKENSNIIDTLERINGSVNMIRNIMIFWVVVIAAILTIVGYTTAKMVDFVINKL